LTFIVCTTEVPTPEGEMERVPPPPSEIRRGEEWDAPGRMLGDVNLFLSRDVDNGGHGKGAPVAGEVNIMVAVSSARGRGVGTAVLRALMWYVGRAGEELLREWIPDDDDRPTGVRRLVAKIDAGNERSVELFRRAGFSMVSEKPNYFGEIEMAWVVGALEWKDGVPRILRYEAGDERDEGEVWH
jgi:RimJ/RimL family protein N-acetyltransferase